jgi:hypothetical protein
MGLVAEFEIGCEHLPLVSVAVAVPEATLVLELQFNHDELPLPVKRMNGRSGYSSRTACRNSSPSKPGML